MMEAKRKKLEKENEVSSLQKQVDSLSSSLESLRSKASLVASGINESAINQEQLRSESLMKELCSIRVCCSLSESPVGGPGELSDTSPSISRGNGRFSFGVVGDDKAPPEESGSLQRAANTDRGAEEGDEQRLEEARSERGGVGEEEGDAGERGGKGAAATVLADKANQAVAEVGVLDARGGSDFAERHHLHHAGRSGSPPPLFRSNRCKTIERIHSVLLLFVQITTHHVDAHPVPFTNHDTPLQRHHGLHQRR